MCRVLGHCHHFFWFSGAFQCHDGIRIPSWHKCNQWNDCSDGEDEEDCSAAEDAGTLQVSLFQLVDTLRVTCGSDRACGLINPWRHLRKMS